MALAITNNVASLNAQNNLNRTSGMLNKSLERLSSGLKINRGADGPAALVISEQQRAQIAGLQTAIQNTSKAVSVVQTAEGALNEINALLVKVRSLALDSANAGVNDSNSLAANQAEVTNALQTIDRIAANTQFGQNKKLLDGSSGMNGTATDPDVTFLRATADTTAGSGYTVNVTTAATKGNVTAGTAQTGNLAADETLTINNVQIVLAAGSDQATVVNRINQFSGQTGVTADVSGGDLRLIANTYGANSTVSVVSDKAAAATSTGIGTTVLTNTGVDIVGDINGNAATGIGNILTGTAGATKGISLSFAAASVTATVTGAQGTVSVTDNSLVFQIGANAGQTAKIGIDKMASQALGLGVSGVQFGNLASINVTSAQGSQDSIKIIDAAINDVTSLRGRLGAFQQNTLESTGNNLRTMLENTTAAESTIRDTDFAQETANFSKSQVLMQVGTTVLQNANQTSQLILSLLRG
jgi:flagellin